MRRSRSVLVLLGAFVAAAVPAEAVIRAKVGGGVGVRATTALTVTSRWAEGELLVRRRPAVTTPGAAALRARLGAAAAVTLPVPGLERVTLARGVSVESALAACRRDPAVLYCEPNYLVEADRAPNDPRFPDLHGLRNHGTGEGYWDADIDADEAWDVTTGSARGGRGRDRHRHRLHPSRTWPRTSGPTPARSPATASTTTTTATSTTSTAINAITGDGDPMDDDGHGTHVAGTIGAVGDNGVGVAGVTWRVKIIAAKFLNGSGEGTTADAITCIDYIGSLRARGVPIVAVNNSWGGGDYSQALPRRDCRAARCAVHGRCRKLVGTTQDFVPHYPAAPGSAESRRGRLDRRHRRALVLSRIIVPARARRRHPGAGSKHRDWGVRHALRHVDGDTARHRPGRADQGGRPDSRLDRHPQPDPLRRRRDRGARTPHRDRSAGSTPPVRWPAAAGAFSPRWCTRSTPSPASRPPFAS